MIYDVQDYIFLKFWLYLKGMYLFQLDKQLGINIIFFNQCEQAKKMSI